MSSGCMGGARVELAAADALDQLQKELAASVNEMHADILQGDARREQAITDALVARLTTGGVAAEAVAQHKAEYSAALARIRADRQTQWMRLLGTRDNLLLVGEVADGLRRLAIDSMSLEDEARRYLMSVVESVRGRALGTAPPDIPFATDAMPSNGANHE